MAIRKLPSTIESIKAKSSGLCYYCGIKLTPSKIKKHRDDNFTVDHKKPKALGGTNHISILVPCCRKCNNIKGMSDIEGFRWKIIKMEFERKNGVQFTDEQFKWLDENGYKIKLPSHKFHFEHMNRFGIN